MEVIGLTVYETYLANVKKFVAEHPGVRIEAVTMTAHHPLSPSRELLGELVEMKNRLSRQVIEPTPEEKNLAPDTVIHNRAYDEIRFEERYKAEVRASQAAMDALRSIATHQGDIVIVCYEKMPKKCHRHVIMTMLRDPASWGLVQ
jgi:uncharacterized protein YeaO (DUF488 family)